MKAALRKEYLAKKKAATSIRAKRRLRKNYYRELAKLARENASKVKRRNTARRDIRKEARSNMKKRHAKE